jgi:plastocyanin
MIPDRSNSADLDSTDPLGRATQALRDLAVPQGPSPELVAATKQSLHRAESDAGPERLFIFRPTLLRIAAAIAILCGAAVVIYHATLGRNKPSDTIVQKPVAPTPKISPTPGPPVSPTRHIEQQPTPPLVRHTAPPRVSTPPPALADGVIAGRVWFDGVPPAPTPLANVFADAHCLKLHGGPFMDESVMVGADKSLANVVVSVSDGLSSWLHEEFPPPAAAMLDQKGCVFVPHVVAVMVGQPLVVKNSDPVAHNVRVLAVNNPPANLGQPSDGENETEKFQSPEVFRIKCDMHPWMEAWVRVVDNPFFAVTGPDGRFSLHGLPPGTYTIKAWHEQLGVREMQVTIAPGRGSAVDFAFGPAPRGD